MMNPYWSGRGEPWEFDAGPPRNRAWARLFAETPNYRGLGKAVVGREAFRWHFGPIFYRGRLQDGAVKVLVIGQEGAQDESLAHRAFMGGTGSRLQHLLVHLGITRSYLFLNTFVYPIFGQYTDELRRLAQDPASPIVGHRHRIFDYVVARNDLRLVIAVGTAAKESVVTWVRSHGGQCAGGPSDVGRCDASALGPRVRLVGVLHPGGAAQGGGAGAAVVADFRRAIGQIEGWAEADPTWLPPDPDGSRRPASDYAYRSAPIPFRDLPFGFSWRLGRGGTSSNRTDGQRSIQLFSAGGRYNGRDDRLSYPSTAAGTPEGYVEESGDLAYEPPRRRYLDYDQGPDRGMATLLQGGSQGLDWPDFAALGARTDPSLGRGPIYRGRFRDLKVVVLADQQSHDDLFCGRALTGDAGQHLQGFLEAMGITRSYLILRVLPVDILDLPAATVRALVDHAATRAVYGEVFRRVRSANPGLGLVLGVGPYARRLLSHLATDPLPVVEMKAWRQSGVRDDWERALDQLRAMTYPTDATPTFAYGGRRRQIPRADLPYGSLRWRGTSGDRAVRAMQDGQPSPHYFKLFMPEWAYRLAPEPLSAGERAAVDQII